MDTIDTIHSAGSAGAGKISLNAFKTVQPISRQAHRLLASFALWMEKRESRRVLRYLTDGELRDIGLTRSEAKTEVRKSFFWD